MTAPPDPHVPDFDISLTATPLAGARAGALPGKREQAIARSRWRPVATLVMAVALACSPAYTLRAHLGALPTTALELLLLAAIATGLYAFWDQIPWRSPYLIPAGLLLVAATVDTLVAPDRRAAAGLWKAYFVEPVLAALVIVAISRERSRARLLLAGLAVAGTVAAATNIAAVGSAVVHHSFSVVTPPVAIYNSANDVPLYLEPLVAFGLALAFYSEDRRERLIAAAFVVVAGVAILGSYSRAGWFTLAALVLFVALFSRRRWQALGGVALVGAAAFLLSGSVRRRLLVEVDFTSPQNTVGLRLTLWRSALNMLAHHPIFGGGLSGFKAAVLPYRDPGYHEDLIYPHDLLLNFWSETGLLGAVAFVWIAVQAVRQGLRGLAAGAWPRMMAIGLLGLILAYVLHGVVDAPYFKNDLALGFWALVGVQLGSLSLAPSVKYRAKPGEGSPPPLASPSPAAE